MTQSYKPPNYAISIRQPWAWAIIHAGKHLENRGQGALRAISARIRPGHRFVIHASQGMTRGEYESARSFMLSRQLVKADDFPRPEALVRGACIGEATYSHPVSESASPWFMGPRAMHLKDVEEWNHPLPCDGMLGAFDWQIQVGRAVMAEVRIQPAKKWMLKW